MKTLPNDRVAENASLSQLGSSDGNDERIPLAALTSSAEHFAKLRGFKIPVTAITTAEEKQKFKEEWTKYIIGSSSSSKNEARSKSINFMDWAMDWNRFVDEMERGSKPLCAINRKHANHLEHYFKKYFAKSNAHTTLHTIRHEDEQLRNDLRETDSSVDYCMVAEPSAPVRSLPRLPPPQQPPAATTQHHSIQTPLRLNLSSAPAPHFRMQLHPIQPPLQPSSLSAQARSPQVCQTCGHMRRKGYFRQYHTTTCNVSEAERNPPCFCDVFENRRKRQKRHYHICNCPRCII